jgi:hypothetical protein
VELNMRKITATCLFTAMFSIVNISHSYIHADWSAKILTEEADLIVIAAPLLKSQPTGKRMFLEGINPKMEVVEMETKFEIKSVLKGMIESDEFVLLHLFYKEEPKIRRGGPSLRKYKKDEYYREYLMFLKDEGNGVYTPTSGQVDPNYAIRELSN